MAKASGIDAALHDIDQKVAKAAASRQATWFDRLPGDAADVLLAARTKFQSGKYGSIKRHTLARVLCDHAADHGWRVCDHKRMSEWLAKQG